jgi:chitin disaccharide deacetylase
MRIQNRKIGLIVCSDDFGASPEINRAIVRLLELKRISAVSCLVTGQAWSEGAPLLRMFKGAVDIGLHLSCDAVTVDKTKILKAFRSQLDLFVRHFGAAPDYIDGHKHIHQLPVFRTVLFEFIGSAGLDKIYIRNSAMGKRGSFGIKNIPITSLGHWLKYDLRKKGIPTNSDFLGVYDFNSKVNAADILDQILGFVRRSNSILMTHPGCQPGLVSQDPIAPKRVEEWKYLESDQYQETMSRHGLYPARFSYD